MELKLNFGITIKRIQYEICLYKQTDKFYLLNVLDINKNVISGSVLDESTPFVDDKNLLFHPSIQTAIRDFRLKMERDITVTQY